MGKSSAKSQKKTKKGGKRRQARVYGVTTTKCIVPALFRGKMFYNTVLALAPAAGGATANVFRLNSVFDPDFTGAGSTVVGYTQISALYGRYRVLAAKVFVEFVNVSSTIPLTVFITLNPVTTVGVNIATILAQRRVWTRGIGTCTGSCTVSHTCGGPVGALYGVPERQVRDEDDFAALVGGNPNNGVYAHVGAYADGAAAGSLTIHVRIEYDVVWSLPLEMT
jgi:hypothetical protein